jgi:hypothetical protein
MASKPEASLGARTAKPKEPAGQPEVAVQNLPASLDQILEELGSLASLAQSPVGSVSLSSERLEVVQGKPVDVFVLMDSEQGLPFFEPVLAVSAGSGLAASQVAPLAAEWLQKLQQWSLGRLAPAAPLAAERLQKLQRWSLGRLAPAAEVRGLLPESVPSQVCEMHGPSLYDVPYDVPSLYASAEHKSGSSS